MENLPVFDMEHLERQLSRAAARQRAEMKWPGKREATLLFEVRGIDARFQLETRLMSGRVYMTKVFRMGEEGQQYRFSLYNTYGEDPFDGKKKRAMALMREMMQRDRLPYVLPKQAVLGELRRVAEIMTSEWTEWNYHHFTFQVEGGDATFTMETQARGGGALIELFSAHGWDLSRSHKLYSGFKKPFFSDLSPQARKALLDALTKGADPGVKALETVQAAINAVAGGESGAAVCFRLPDSDNEFQLYIGKSCGRVVTHVQSFDRRSGYRAENILFSETEAQAREALSKPGMAEELRKSFYHLSDVVDDKKD